MDQSNSERNATTLETRIDQLECNNTAHNNNIRILGDILRRLDSDLAKTDTVREDQPEHISAMPKLRVAMDEYAFKNEDMHRLLLILDKEI